MRIYIAHFMTSALDDEGWGHVPVIMGSGAYSSMATVRAAAMAYLGHVPCIHETHDDAGGRIIPKGDGHRYVEITVQQLDHTPTLPTYDPEELCSATQCR